jgi:flagellar hook-basal body protein
VSVDNGMYMVTAADTNGFSISARAATAAIGAQSAQATTFSWQKIAGNTGTEVAIPIGTAVTSVVGASITIPGGPYAAGYGGAALAPNDVVYIAGFAHAAAAQDIPAGYYKVTAVGANTVMDYLTSPLGAANAATVTTNTSSIQKVGEVAAADTAISMDTMPLSWGAAAIGAAGVGFGTVTMSVGANSNYKVGDKFSFGDLGANVIVDFFEFEANHLYEIDSVSGTNITFKVKETGVGPHVGGSLGYAGENLAGGGGYTTANNILGATTYTNNFSRFFAEMGISTTKFLDNNKQVQNIEKSYSASDKSKNMTGGKIAISGITNHTISVFDSQGTSHVLQVAFAKLEDNKWAVEVYGKKDANGEFEMTADEGLPLADGFIEFDGKGGLISVAEELKKFPSIKWLGGANPSTISIDWGAIAGFDPVTGEASDTRGVTQVNGDADIRFINSDGYGFGLLKDVSITEEGFVLAHFSNGTQRKVFKIPVATFANLDGLTELTGGVLIPTNESGKVILKEAGRGGVAVITSGALAGSNVDKSDQMLGVIKSANLYQMNTTLISTQKSLNDSLLRAFG